MIPEEDRPTEFKENPSRGTRLPRSRGRTARAHFYWSLLLFVVVSGLLLLAVPSLRSRLVQRSQDLYGAIWGTRAPIMADVSDQQSPYPEEYEREAQAFPDAGQGIPEDWIFRIPSRGSAEGQGDTSSLVSPPIEKADTGLHSVKGKGVSGTGSETEEADSGVQYSTGKAENEAYTLLLEKYPKVAALVRGEDASLQFLSWGGAEVQEGVYWVQLIFETGGGREVFIWQVTLQSGEVQPLSYNARTVS